MTDQDKVEINKSPEKSIPAGEQPIEFKKEGMPVPERREIPRDEKIVLEQLKKEIDVINQDDKKAEAEKKSQKIGFLGEKEKLEHLLQLAREKGVVFAIAEAKKMNEPYLLDMLHDLLAKEGFYLKMGQATTDDDNDDDNKKP